MNVGGEGTLLLSQAIRRLGRVELPLPTPALGSVGRLSRRFGFVDYSPEQMRFLNFGRVVDTTVLRTQFGYLPRVLNGGRLGRLRPYRSAGDHPGVGRGGRRPGAVGAVPGRRPRRPVGARLRPAPQAPGLRAVQDA